MWAATGIKLPNRERYDRFGKLRNAIQHFGPHPGLDPTDETLHFVFEVIDPFINDCWGLFAVDYDEDDSRYVYFVMALVHREIKFLVSPEAAATFGGWEVDWSAVSEEYRNEMYSRVKHAIADNEQIAN